MLTVCDKLKVIKRVENGEDRRKIITDFNIGVSTICNTVSGKAKLQKFVRSGQSLMGGEIHKTMKKPKLEQLAYSLCIQVSYCPSSRIKQDLSLFVYYCRSGMLRIGRSIIVLKANSVKG